MPKDLLQSRCRNKIENILVKILVALLSLLGVAITAYFGYRALTGVSVFPIPTSTPTPTPPPLSFIVQVRADDTGEPIPDAEIIINLFSAKGGFFYTYSDESGVAKLSLDGRFRGTHGILFVYADTYEEYSQKIVLAEDALPSVIPLERKLLVETVRLAALNIVSEEQSDGTVKHTVKLTLDPVGFGDLELTAPARIKLGETGVVRLVIVPDPALTGLAQVAVTPLPTEDLSLVDTTDYVLRFSDKIQIYPVMIAELRGANYVEIISDDQPAKPIVSSSPAEWIWLVTPKVGGKQVLVLFISIPVLIDQAREVISAQPLRSIPIEILVEEPATPAPSKTPSPIPTPTPTPTPTSTLTPTPTPLPVVRRVSDQLIDNSASILTALIALVGILTGVYAKVQSDRRETKIKDLEATVAKNKEEREALSEEIVRLRSIPWWQFWRK